MKLYSVKDCKSGFMSIIAFKNDDLAIRGFSNMVNEPVPNLVNSNPSDFELWSLGSFDQDSGVITSDIQYVTNALSVKVVNHE